MEKILKYSLLFCIVLFVLFLLSVITAKIPKSAIQENIKESEEVFKNNLEINELVSRRDYTFIHQYADGILLNIINCIDSEKPVTSVMEAKYYSLDGDRYIKYNYTEMIETEVEGNTEYIRYWHGQMSILRPLLIFLNLGQIYLINIIAFWTLSVVLIIILIKKKYIKLLISYIIGFIMCAIPIVPLCLEYSPTFYIMIIVTIIAMYIERNNEKLNTLFFITGILINYFDFLTTEIITIFVPIIFILNIRFEQRRLDNIKEAIQFIIKAFLIWLTGYTLMWISKWILASIILDVNITQYVKEHVVERINGKIMFTERQELPFLAVLRNICTLYPLNIQKNIKKLMIIPIAIIVFEVIFMKKKKIKNELWFSFTLLLIAIVPYIRYIILANHSFMHYYFTFRSQIITIICIILAIIYSIDKNIMKKEIRIKMEKKLN